MEAPDHPALRALFDEHLAPPPGARPPDEDVVRRAWRQRRRRQRATISAALAVGAVVATILLDLPASAPPASFRLAVSPALDELPPVDDSALAGLAVLLRAVNREEVGP